MADPRKWIERKEIVMGRSVRFFECSRCFKLIFRREPPEECPRCIEKARRQVEAQKVLDDLEAAHRKREEAGSGNL